MLPPSIPIFPLPNTVLFPNVFLPLHIFELRFKRMMTDALLGDRIIGMTLLRPGWESDYEGCPAVFSVGCAGLITHSEILKDGRYNIVLRGLQKFQICGEDNGQGYRIARVSGIAEPVDEVTRFAIQGSRGRLEELLTQSAKNENAEGRLPKSVSDEDLVNALAQYLDIDAIEKQALLEREGLAKRCESLIELLEMKLLVARYPAQSHQLQ
jgi:Lon protease-like protein